MNIRRLSILTFAFVFGFVSMTGFFTAANAEEAKGIMPSDIDGHWMVNTLKDFNKKGYLKGDESGRVFPDKNMSRAEYAAVINRIMQFSEESSKISDFTDVSSNAWYRSDMAKALQAGYMKGTGANTMSPEAAITREQAFVMLYRLTYPKGKEGQKVADISKFSDAATISDYAREAISVLVAAGVISGEFNRLNPKKDISRAQAVLILSKSERKMAEVLKNINEQAFEGTGAGYGGTMKLKVLFDKGKIVDIKIISDNETGSYLSRAKAIIAQIIEKQSVEGIDNISGATLSCNAIKDAVKDCISQQKGEGSIGTVGSTGSSKGGGVAVAKQEVDFAELNNGTYEGRADGYRRNSMSVKVTVQDGKISEIEYANHDDAGYLRDEGAKGIIQKIINTQSTKVDTVSGATKSSIGLINAVVNALEKAGGKKSISGQYDGNGKKIISANLVGNKVAVKNVTIEKDITVSEKVADGDVTLENVTISGKLIINGGGSHSIYLKNTKVEGDVIIAKNKGERPRLVVDSSTKLENVLVKTPAIIKTLENAKIKQIELAKDLETGDKEVTIDANVKTLRAKAKNGNVTITSTSKVENLRLPKSVSEFNKEQKEYKSDGFKLVLQSPNVVKNGSNDAASTLEASEKAAKTASDKLIKELTVDRKLKDGIFIGVGKGFNDTATVKTKVKIANGEVKSIEILPGDSLISEDPGYIEKAEGLLNFISGENARKNIAVVRCCYKYTGQIENIKTSSERNAKATELLGTNCAKIVREISNSASSTDVVREISKAVRTYLAGEYDKDDLFDSVSGATLTAGGIANSVGNALELSAHDNETNNDINEIEVTGILDKKVFTNRILPLNLSKLKVKLINKNGTINEIGIDQFAENGITMKTKNGALITDGMKLKDFPTYAVPILIEHEPSLREDVFSIVVNDEYNENWTVGMQYKIGDEDWKDVENPKNAKPTPGAPYDANNIDVHQKVAISRDEWNNNFVGKNLKLRIVRKNPTDSANSDSKYIIAKDELKIDKNDENKELKFSMDEKDHEKDLNVNFFYKITFDVEKEESQEPQDDYDIEKTTSIEIKKLPKMQYFIGEKFDVAGMIVTLKSSDGKVKDVTPEFFDDYGISTDPENETVLTPLNAFLKNLKVTFEYGDLRLEIKSKEYLMVKKSSDSEQSTVPEKPQDPANPGTPGEQPNPPANEDDQKDNEDEQGNQDDGDDQGDDQEGDDDSQDGENNGGEEGHDED